MDVGRCPDDRPACFPVLEPDPALARARAVTHAAAGMAPDDPGPARCPGSVAKEGPRRVGLGGSPGCGLPGARLYRSLEDLHWAVANGNGRGPGPPGRGGGSGFVFHCRTTSDWYEVSAGPPDLDCLLLRACGNAPGSPRPRGPAGRELPPSAKAPPWLFPTASQGVLNGDAKRRLKENLRLQSHKAAESHGPVRPQARLGEPARKDGAGPEGGSGGRGAPAPRPTCPAAIKEEAMRRLKLRRQNSTPDLTRLPREEGGQGVGSRTAEPAGGRGRSGYLAESSPAAAPPERGRSSPARTPIPSFEEFKRMRKEEKRLAAATKAEQPGSEEKSFAALSRKPAIFASCPALTAGEPPAPWRRLSAGCQVDGRPAHPRQPPQQLDLPPGAQPSSALAQAPSAGPPEEPRPSPDPICTGPAPGPPLHTAAVPRGSRETENRRQATSLGGLGPAFGGAEKQTRGEAQSSCCPSLLLEAAADLSGYGVRFQQMKDGLIGSAIDLIKKSCTADAAALQSSHHQESDDITANEQDNQSGPVSTATLDSSSSDCNRKPAGVLRQPDCHSLPGCRRSSSDAAYGTTETAKAQRECRLRPHFSDPMPADAVKRKQLEMRIAAAAWGLGQKRRQEKDSGGGDPSGRTADPSLSVRPREAHPGAGSGHRTKHRWSNLSTDSGVVGLSERGEEREDEEEERARKGKAAEVERADSGIGPAMAKKWKSRVGETARSVQAWVAHRPCVDCGERDVSEAEPRAAAKRRENLCSGCGKRRRERKEAILEFVNTENSYGEDLRIIKEEFHLPMQAAALLTPEQLAVVFSNIQELIEVNEKFLERLHDSTEQAFDQDDEDFLTVCIGEMFLEFVNMLPAFQTYCIHQSTSINMLNTLEKEKELLRIFLDVSQNDNTALRRMNLRSFLMAPLQRVTKYPLLLSRISSSTPEYHPDHGGLREAKSRVESHLEHINMKTKQEGGGPAWSLRSFRRDSRRHRETVDLEMREVALKAVGWPREVTCCAMEGTLQSSQPSDGQWARKGSRALKFQSLHALLMVNAGREAGAEGGAGGRGWGEPPPPVRDAALVLIRDKGGGKLALFRRPIPLGHCVVSSDPDCDDTFELLDIRKEAFVFRDADRPRTRHWFRLIKRYSRDLGSWRKRRNALPNIMINATYGRT
uniref:uncharacterized protein arhgef49 n=1 Tax=Pristiophorus japonicus TaxID=55135 RepID=UPI00398E9D4E